MSQQILRDKKLLLLGGGAIAESMIRGVTGAKAVAAGQIFVTNKSNAERLLYLKERYGVNTFTGLDGKTGTEILKTADLILLASKPHDIPLLLEGIQGKIGNPVILSVAAGITTGLMESILGGDVQVVRAMPNTSCAVLESATAISFGRFCTTRAKELSEAVLAVLGTVSVVDENMMDVVTGVSGSGPAYFYYMVEAMQQAAESLGLSSETARTMILQTLFGAGKMMQETGLDARDLRRQVTSPNGTTMAGIRVFEEANFKELMEKVITHASERSREMGEQQAAILR